MKRLIHFEFEEVHEFGRQPDPEETDIYRNGSSKYSDTTSLFFKLD
jgi:hypothetical protein